MDGGDMADDGDVVDDGAGEEATPNGGLPSEDGLKDGDGVFTDEDVDWGSIPGVVATADGGHSSEDRVLDDDDGDFTDEEIDWGIIAEEDPTVKILSSNGLRLSVQIDLKSTVENLKSAVARMSGWPVGQQRLIFNGRLMKNDQTLESYGIGHYQTVQLVTRRDAGTQSTNSTPREAGSDEHCPCERPDLIGPLSSTERVRDDGAPEMEETQAAKNSMNKPDTPNTDPLPNPWTSTGTGGRHIISGVDLNSIVKGLGLPDREQTQNSRADCRVSCIRNRRAYNRLHSMYSASRRQAGGRHTNTNERFNPMARGPQAEGRRTNAGAEVNPMAGMSSASKPQAGGIQTSSGVRFYPMTPYALEQMLVSIANLRASIESSSARMNSGTVPFEVQYAAQLLQLLEMGFYNFRKNMEALIVTRGDVRAAVELLLD